MKKFLFKLTALSLLLAGMVSPAYAADQWSESSPAGTSQMADADANIIINNEALDRLNRYAKFGLGVNYSTPTALSILTGSIAIPNAAATTIRWRSLTTATTAGWSDLDTGVEENSTQYYLYVTADTDIEGIVFKISKSAAPSGSTYYRAIASFYNNSSGNIENVVSYRTEQGTDYRDLVKGWIHFNGSGTVAISDQYNVSSITDNATGDYTVTWDTDFASASYVMAGMAYLVNEQMFVISHSSTATAAGSKRIRTVDADGTNKDATEVMLLAVGDRT